MNGPSQPGVRNAAQTRRGLLATPGGCVLTDWYADGDPSTPRPLALPRYEFYRTWLHEVGDARRARRSVVERAHIHTEARATLHPPSHTTSRAPTADGPPV